jgi:F420-dependent methylenetetrahydromethanopterin dehydrogenase
MAEFWRRRKPETDVLVTDSSVEREKWTDFEAWLFRVVTGVYHTDPENGADAVINTFYIQFDDNEGIIVTPETAAQEMEQIREAFEADFPHIFEAALPTEKI